MAIPVQKKRYTPCEYLALEEKAEQKHEYHAGEILAMSGGTFEHSLVSANVIREMGNRLKGKPCRALESNMRVRVELADRYFYPDIAVVCGGPEFDPEDRNHTTIINPRVLVEVLSDSTEGYDRGEKFQMYRMLESLQEYIVIAQRQPHAEAYLRQGDGTWSLAPCDGIESTLRLRSLRIEIPMSEIYDGVTFRPPLPPPAEVRTD
jgi:Uma2 family endonuclease